MTGFDSIRRAVWPDCEFYDVSFLDQRLKLAAMFARDYVVVRADRDWKNVASSQHSVVRALLYRNGEVFLPNIGALLLEHNTRHDITIPVQRLLKWLATNSLRRSTGIPATNTSAQLLEDVAGYIVESLNSIGPAEQLSSTPPLSRSVYNCLFDISVLGHPHDVSEAVTYSTYNHISEFRAEKFFGKMLRQYLAVLSRRGINVSEYGRFVKSHLAGQAPFAVQYLTRRGRRIKLEIQDIRTGAKPEDWYIWFVNSTDEFVGDFWHLVDPAPLYIPGAWVDRE